MSRITHMMTTQTLLRDVQGSHERVARTQQKLASGKELTRPPTIRSRPTAR